MSKLLLHELRIRRTAIIGWGIGIAIFAAYIIVLFPEFAEPLEAFNLEEIPAYQIFGDFEDMASFKGFVSAEVFTFLPILLGIYAIVNGTGTLAGEEDSGTLEPLMALPLRRWQIVLSKGVALGIALLLILLVVGMAAVIAMNTLPADVDTGSVGAGDIVLATLATWPLVMFFAALSLFLAAFMPSRRYAAITATAVLVVSYFGNNLANLVELLSDIQFLFVFSYFDVNSILEGNVNTGDLLLMFALSALFLALAIFSFQRRNVTVGAWPWQRGRVPVRPDGALDRSSSTAAGD